MDRYLARTAGWLLVLVISITLGACGGDEYDGKMNNQNMPNMDHVLK